MSLFQSDFYWRFHCKYVNVLATESPLGPQRSHKQCSCCHYGCCFIVVLLLLLLLLLFVLLSVCLLLLLLLCYTFVVCVLPTGNHLNFASIRYQASKVHVIMYAQTLIKEILYYNKSPCLYSVKES